MRFGDYLSKILSIGVFFFVFCFFLGGGGGGGGCFLKIFLKKSQFHAGVTYLHYEHC